jgi:carboxypeptidase Q
MIRHRLVCLLLLLPLTGAALSQPAEAPVNSDVRNAADQLAGSVYTGPVMKTLRELSDGFGGRLTGSPAYNRAAEWAASKFRSYGISNVKLEPFTMANGWVRGTASGELLTPVARPLHIESLGWSPSTPAGGIQGEVIEVDDISADHIRSIAGKINGKIIFMDEGKILGDHWQKTFPGLEASYPLLRDAGALGVIFSDHDRNNVLNATDPNWGSTLFVLPGAQLGMEDSQFIRRSLQQGPVTIRFELRNTTSGPTQVNNVIAEIRGSQSPDEWILVGAHLDSWDYGTGAQDNGTGTAMVLDVARAIAGMGKTPRRSVRFALWGGEEQGLLGSYAYTQTHLAEMAKCIAVLNTDNGSGHPKGWKLQSRKDLQQAMQPISDTVLKDIGGGGLSLQTTYDTDHGPFMLQGIPALDLWVDLSHYVEVHHKSSDTYDKVDPVDFKADTAIVAVTAWIIAENSKPIAPHLDHAGVAEILKNADLDTLLAYIGHWKP